MWGALCRKEIDVLSEELNRSYKEKKLCNNQSYIGYPMSLYGDIKYPVVGRRLNYMTLETLFSIRKFLVFWKENKSSQYWLSKKFKNLQYQALGLQIERMITLLEIHVLGHSHDCLHSEWGKEKKRHVLKVKQKLEPRHVNTHLFCCK